jgi:cytochrome c oxidase subunit 2
MTRTFQYFALLCAIVGGLAAVAAAEGGRTRQDQPQTIEVDAERFSFSPSEVRVRADRPVEFRLRSDDTDHGFRILGTDINVIIPKRGRGHTTVTFQPPKAGRYTFECSKVCGAGHAFMRGTLIAE